MLQRHHRAADQQPKLIQNYPHRAYPGDLALQRIPEPQRIHLNTNKMYLGHRISTTKQGSREK